MNHISKVLNYFIFIYLFLSGSGSGCRGVQRSTGDRCGNLFKMTLVSSGVCAVIITALHPLGYAKVLIQV